MAPLARAWLPRFVILAILACPARLLGQSERTSEATLQAPQPFPTATVLPAEQPESTGGQIPFRTASEQPPAEQAPGRVALGPVETSLAGLWSAYKESCDRWQSDWGHILRINDTPECGPPREAVFGFGGLFTKGSMGDTLDIFNVTYDQCYIIGLGYQRYHWSTGRFHWGWEIGTAGRYNDGHSMEFWGGATVRHDGITLLNVVRISPSATAGLSAVTDTMGHEPNRERARQGDGTFLYYLGPEFAASLPSYPNIELFYRLHHRCGGGGSLGRMREGYNANCLGLRFRY